MVAFFTRVFNLFRVPIHLVYPIVFLLIIITGSFAIVDRLGLIHDFTIWMNQRPGLWLLLVAAVIFFLVVLLSVLRQLFHWDFTAPWLDDGSAHRGGVWILDMQILLVCGLGYFSYRMLKGFVLIDLLLIFCSAGFAALIGLCLNSNHHVVQSGETERSPNLATFFNLLRANAGQVNVDVGNFLALNEGNPSLENLSSLGEDLLVPGDEIRLPIGVRPGHRNPVDRTRGRARATRADVNGQQAPTQTTEALSVDQNADTAPDPATDTGPES